MAWQVLVAIVGLALVLLVVAREVRRPRDVREAPPDDSGGGGRWSEVSAAKFVVSAPPPSPRQGPRTPIGAPRYLIEYGDAYGEISEREISVLAIAEEPITGLLYVNAYCHLRDDDRTFRVDRMLRVARLPSMQVIISLAAHFRALAEDLPGGMQWWGGLSPEQLAVRADHGKVMDRARPGLNALIWLALADGEISEPEMSVLYDWIEYRAAVRDARLSWDRDLARGYIREARPTMDAIRGGLGRLGKAEKSQFLKALDALSAADGAVCRFEARRMVQIRAAAG